MKNLIEGGTQGVEKRLIQCKGKRATQRIKKKGHTRHPEDSKATWDPSLNAPGDHFKYGGEEGTPHSQVNCDKKSMSELRKKGGGGTKEKKGERNRIAAWVDNQADKASMGEDGREEEKKGWGNHNKKDFPGKNYISQKI